MSADYIPGGNISGWRPDTQFITTPSEHWIAVDEPQAYSIGGNVLYWIHFGSMGSFDITAADNNEWWPNINSSKEWIHFDEQGDVSQLPWFSPRYDSASETFGPQNGNGVYVYNDFSPPIPYKGKVYLIHYNSLIAFTTQSVASPTPLSMATIASTPSTTITTPSETALKQKLETEVQKIINAGHLRPGYINHGLFVDQAIGECMDNGQDYFHDISDIIYTLYRAYPYLSTSLQQDIVTYLENEIRDYAPYDYSHIGWATGAAREAFDLPTEVEQARASFPKGRYINGSYGFIGWGEGNGYGGTSIPPHMFYAMWKYAQLRARAGLPYDVVSLFNSISYLMSPTPPNSVIIEYPFINNSYITGLIGFIELGRIAGYADNSPQLSGRILELNRLLSLRANTFSKDMPAGGYSRGSGYCRTLNASRNFIYLFNDPNDSVADLADYIRDNALSKVRSTLDEYYFLTPYWFLGKYENAQGENSIQPLYDVIGLFQAKAQILEESREKLYKYLDVPAFERGDLFYIQNLVSVIEAAPSSSQLLGDIDNSGTVNVTDLSILINRFGGSDTSADLDNSGKVNVIDLSILLANFGR